MIAAVDALSRLRERNAALPPAVPAPLNPWFEVADDALDADPGVVLLAEIAALLGVVVARTRAGTHHDAAPSTPDGEPRDAPVTSWAAVARAAGVSMDTLSRRRKAWGIAEGPPYFATADEAQGWYRRNQLGPGALRPTAVQHKPPRRTSPSACGTGGTTLADLLSARSLPPSRGRGTR